MDNELLNRFGKERITERQIDELIGLAKGILADGHLADSEVEFLHSWLAVNVGVTGNPLIATLYRRIAEVLRDGVVDDEERADLFQTLSSFGSQQPEPGELMKPTSLPLSDPFPVVEHPGRLFCFTGTFTFGTRAIVEEAARKLGAEIGNVTKKTHFLIIGDYATESWLHSTYGHKIMKAVELREAGHLIHIVAESHWITHL